MNINETIKVMESHLCLFFISKWQARVFLVSEHLLPSLVDIWSLKVPRAYKAGIVYILI